MPDPQVIMDDAGRPAFAVIPWRDYQRLTGGQVPDDDLTDEALYDRAVAENEEKFPIGVVDRIVAGESPIRVFREHRRMTQKAVAEAAGISTLYISQIERKTRTGSIATLAAIAKALRVDLDDLINQ